MLIREIQSLREDFISSLESQGYSSLYPPQEDAIKSGVLDGENLVLATPTASGKTLVAMIAAMRTIDKGGKVVYLAPLRALASEKLEEFRAVFGKIPKEQGSKARISVRISTGDYDSSGESLGSADVIIMTNERFDSILRHGVSWLDSVGLFISDEVHLVGEAHRGPTLEMILAKILRFASNAQVIALSATIRNTDDIASWLGAKLVNTEWRPVQLVEGIYDYGVVSFSNGETKKIPQSNRGTAIDIAIDTVKGGGQSLIFCETRKRAVSIAEKASEIAQTVLSFEDSSRTRQLSQAILTSGEETDISRRLSHAVSRGVAFHHAGLDSKHRKIVEEAFKAREIKILAATPTLAAGVNLPARRVVLSTLFRYNVEEGGQAPISVQEFKQMAGRAGRPKYDSTGEIDLIAGQGISKEEIEEHYFSGDTEPIRSRLAAEGPLRAHILGLIASQRGIKGSELLDFFENSLLGHQYKLSTIKSRIVAALKFLEEEDLVLSRSKKYLATAFGKRVALLYIDPESAIIMRRGIRYAERGKRHDLGLLHIVVQTPDMMPKFGMRQKDTEELDEILSSKESEFLTPIPTSKEKSFFQEYESLLGNFRTVLALNAWLNEHPEQFLLEKYAIEPGDLHRMTESADWLLYSLGELSRLFGRLDLAVECEDLRERVRYGIKPELKLLTKLEGVGRIRARSLFNAGYKSVESLSEVSLEKLALVPKIGHAVASKIKQQLQ